LGRTTQELPSVWPVSMLAMVTTMTLKNLLEARF
jgi:hypothetical protein